MNDPATFLGFPTDTVNAFTGLATAIAAGVAAGFAAKGVNAWRDEMKGRRKAELAEDVLADFYEVRDVLRWVRSPGGFTDEADGRPRDAEEDEEMARTLDAYFVPIARLERRKDIFSRLIAKRYRFQAVFGENAAEPFGTVRTIEARIWSSARILLRSAKARPCQFHDDPRRLEQERIVFWAGELEAEDQIEAEVGAAVRAIEATCRPAIEARAG